MKTSPLTVAKNLITIDGIDGVGKTTISYLLTENLRKIYGEAEVTRYSLRDKTGVSEPLLKLFSEGNLTPIRQDNIICAMVNRMYENAIKEDLKNGKIVIVDRSEMNLLTWASSRNKTDTYDRRLSFIQKGVITSSLWPGYRVLVTSTPKSIWSNIKDREGNTINDPTSYNEVEELLTHQSQVEEVMKRIPCCGTVNYINICNERVQNSELLDYLNNISKSIASLTVFS